MEFNVVTIFPSIFDSFLSASLLGKSIESGALRVNLLDLREFADEDDRHRSVDEYPYGGGSGMVMKAPPLYRAKEAIVKRIENDGASAKTILMTPQGRTLSQSIARELAREADRCRYVVLCGRYEGIDERVRELADMEISIGDYILAGGEVAAMVLIDALARLIPGGAGLDRSDSHSDGLLEYPQYTRPETYRGLSVPKILLSGDHKRIDEWRRAESIIRTAERRPDLIERANLSATERELAEKIIRRAADRRADEESNV